MQGIILGDARDLTGGGGSSYSCCCRLRWSCYLTDTVLSIAFALAFTFPSFVAGRSTFARVFKPAIFGCSHFVHTIVDKMITVTNRK